MSGPGQPARHLRVRAYRHHIRCRLLTKSVCVHAASACMYGESYVGSLRQGMHPPSPALSRAAHAGWHCVPPYAPQAWVYLKLQKAYLKERSTILTAARNEWKVRRGWGD